MVRRDLEADGGFAEFFRRPGEGLPAEAGAAAREAEARGLVDGMGQLNSSAVPLVGKVPPWRQPPKPVDPDAPRPFGWIAEIPLRTRRAGAALAPDADRWRRRQPLSRLRRERPRGPIGRAGSAPRSASSRPRLVRRPVGPRRTRVRGCHRPLDMAGDAGAGAARCARAGDGDPARPARRRRGRAGRHAGERRLAAGGAGDGLRRGSRRAGRAGARRGPARSTRRAAGRAAAAPDGPARPAEPLGPAGAQDAARWADGGDQSKVARVEPEPPPQAARRLDEATSPTGSAGSSSAPGSTASRATSRSTAAGCS